MHSPSVALVIAALVVRGAPSAAPAQAPDGDAAARERARTLSLELTAAPRLAGTAGSPASAQLVARHLAEAGWKVEIDRRVVLLSLPRRLEFALFANAEAADPVMQRIERFDPAAVPPLDVPAYSAWSASARVRAPVVDVGHGLRGDYELLAENDVDVRGKIALARYGRAYRGVKADLAQRHGCVGLLLWNTPEEDGEARGPAWPEGPWKPGSSAQRGSILPLASFPGDPSTPGWPSPAPGDVEPRRLTGVELAAELPAIPCLPIGARDALAIRERLERRVLADAGLQPGEREPLPVGPGPVEVLLDLDVPRELATIQNVIATLPGAGDGLVLAGSHRDAWVRGAQDSGSGCVALLLAAEELGRRSRVGWKPMHTLLLGFWDAEEFGLIGSTEWAEARAASLRERALCYVNADATVSGTQVRVSGTPGMLSVLRGVLARVTPSEVDQGAGHESLWEQLSAQAGEGGPELGLPGSGSDFAVFLHHLGMAVLELSFEGNSGGQYHTEFDDFAMLERFLDPGWHGHALCGRALGELLACLSEAPGAGFDAAEAAEALARHARACGLETQPDGTSWLGTERAERLEGAFERLSSSLRSARGAAPAPGEAVFYRALEARRGLPGRAWFRNRMWAPRPESGYASETFPTLRVAAREGSESLANELDALAASIEAWALSWRPSAAPAAGN